MTGVISSCGACKFLRRRCTEECIFAPYFSYEQASTHFAAVHKVFGASNVSKLLSHVPVHSRSDAAITISYEALARMEDPIYGCIAHIFALQQQVASLEEEIEMFEKEMANVGINSVAYECSNPYFSAESELRSNEAGQPFLHWGDMDFDFGTSDGIMEMEGYLLDRIVEQVGQQEYNLQSLSTMMYAAATTQWYGGTN